MFRISLLSFLPVLMTTLMTAQTVSVSQPTVWATKPDVAAFEKLENGRLAGAQASIDKLVAVKGPRTIDNTLVPFDDATRQVNAAGYLAGLMEQVHPQATFRDHATAMLTKVSAAQTAIALNHDVYSALASLDLSHADTATHYYVQRQLLEFRLAGVDKDDATRAKLKELNQKATDLQSAFDRNISDDRKRSRPTPAN
jgi:thimet oligopeptidase